MSKLFKLMLLVMVVINTSFIVPTKKYWIAICCITITTPGNVVNNYGGWIIEADNKADATKIFFNKIRSDKLFRNVIIKRRDWDVYEFNERDILK